MNQSKSQPIDLAEGIYRFARQARSPNQDFRPTGSQIELIVVHGISLPPGRFGQGWVESLFLNQIAMNHPDPSLRAVASLRVSAHLLIARDGNLIQFVSFKNRAWHAGISSWSGREHCNDFSIGIEIEGTDVQPYETVQYVQLARVILCLRKAYPTLQPEGLVGHSDIALGRKTDPGPAFDWRRLESLIA
ncbi:MAG: 1,6-anhydro-N-acetylmuramyl-L-alanine amidase AmpD [Gammaproteobacteria bacterium]